MIVSVNISQWTGRKFDRKVTSEVNNSHGTKDAGRFNKILVSRDKLSPIAKAAGLIRRFHYENTLPWGDNGDRVLPASNYFNYTQGLRPLKDDFEQLSNEFVNHYADSIQQAKVELHGMFDERDYPSSADISGRFGIKVAFQPMPDVDDFRLSLTSDSELDRLRQEIGATIADRHAQAVGDLLKRAKEAMSMVVGAVTRQSKNNKARFHGSLMDNIQKIAELIPSLNYTNDPQIEKLRKSLLKMVTDPDTLKNDPTLRSKYLQRAKQLDKMFF